MTTKFTTLIDNEESGRVKCNFCGYHFNFDVHDEENLVMCMEKKFLCLKCPVCNTTSAKKEEH